MTAPLTPAERAALPEHMRHPEAYRYSADSFDNHAMTLDAIDDARAWLRAHWAARAAAEVAAVAQEMEAA